MSRRRITTILVALTLAGCSGVKEYEPNEKAGRTLFMPVVRSAAPEPVYARTRWVRPSDNLPNRDRPGAAEDPALQSSPRLRSVFHLNIKNSSLEETARVLAATSRYSSYTAPSIAAEKITVDNLGTIDELARIIEGKAHIQVVIDHQNKEVRFLTGHTESPRLFDE
jgi:hypothetical protein